MVKHWSETIPCEAATPPPGVVDWSRARGWTKESPSHPKVLAVQRYWAAQAGAAPAPTRAAIDPAELGGLVAHVSLLEITGPPLDFRLRLMGDAVAAWLGHRLEGCPVGAWGLGPDQEDNVRALYRSVYETVAPVCLSGELPVGERTAAFEGLHLPLVDEAGQPTSILGVMGLWQSAATASRTRANFLGP